MRNFIKKITNPFLKSAHNLWFSKPRKYRYKNCFVWVAPTVFPPFLTISTKILLDYVDALSLNKKTFFELGCGCGIISVFAASKGATVTATDINEIALLELKKNSVLNSVSIEILHSNLFDNLSGKSFDYIVINPPYYPKKPNSMAENAWFCGENFEYFEALFKQLQNFITSNNTILMVLSEDCDLKKIKEMASKNNILTQLVLEKKVFSEKNYIFRLVLSQYKD